MTITTEELLSTKFLNMPVKDRIYNFLKAAQGKAYTLRELVDATECTYPSAMKAIEKLDAEKKIIWHKKGRSKFIYYNEVLPYEGE